MNHVFVHVVRPAGRGYGALKEGDLNLARIIVISYEWRKEADEKCYRHCYRRALKGEPVYALEFSTVYEGWVLPEPSDDGTWDLAIVDLSHISDIPDFVRGWGCLLSGLRASSVPWVVIVRSEVGVEATPHLLEFGASTIAASIDEALGQAHLLLEK